MDKNLLYDGISKNYSISKTLRFELIPQGKTRENIENNGIIEKDVKRSINYKKVKKYCDEYHKKFIDECLQGLSLNGLNEYYRIYKIENKTDEQKEEFSKIQKSLRIQIADAFKANQKFEGLFSKDIIIKYLKEIYGDSAREMEEIAEFEKFTTYFKGFSENRKNMYSSEEKSTAIAYRLINENLPKFISNLILYKKHIENNMDIKTKVEESLKPYIKNLNEVFDINNFNNTLTEKGIEEYNQTIAGVALEDGRKIKGLNECINESQEYKIPKMTQLYKQILSDRTSMSFIIDSIDNDKDMADEITDYYMLVREVLELSCGKNKLENILFNLPKYDLYKTYINNDLSITKISNDIFGDWSCIKLALAEYYDESYTGKAKPETKKYADEKEKKIKNETEFSIKYLEEAIKVYNGQQNSICNYFANYLAKERIIEKIEEKYSMCEEIFNLQQEGKKELLNNENAIEKIKSLLDSMKELQEFMKLLVPKNNTIQKDEKFYSEFMSMYESIALVVSLYNKVRNYLTQKPYSDEKVKLNFENPTLLNGWDLNKEKDYLGVMFLKDNKYYLGIMNLKSKKKCEFVDCGRTDRVYQKMEYKLLPSPSKMLPHVFFSKKGIETFAPSEYILKGYEEKKHIKGEKFDINFCHDLIDFYKSSIKQYEDWNKFDFKFSDTNEYSDISKFYKEVEEQGYQISFVNIAEEKIDMLVENGDLYLFQIYSKDFSQYTKGNPNLHTMYFKALFDKENLTDLVYKLNGEAEVFYRKASLSLEKTAIHKAHIPINNKNENNINKTSAFEYDLIKNKRYTVDKFQLHIPITLNFLNKRVENINEIINRRIQSQENINVIGIDRGERNLLYITVVDGNGKLLEQVSLNNIETKYKDNIYKVDYHKRLEKRGEDREEARRNWKAIENIKELKEGYLSIVVHEIVKLMDRYNAIIVIEDLNNGFKNSRQKFEKQVYQKFERRLIEKLNYLVFKERAPKESGGLLNAYQLTNKFESFKKLGKQSGVLFYVPAWCTSKIDPTTGFVNLLDTRYINKEKAKEFVSKFDKIEFNKEENYYEFYTDYTKFSNKSYGIKKDWIICTNGTRVKNYRNSSNNKEFVSLEVNLTEQFNNLFSKYGIKGNLKDSILLQEDAKFFEELLALIKLMVQLRNSISAENKDYILSPVKNSKGYFYDSRLCDKTLPNDADANGAYNIARKGLMLIEQIRNEEDTKLKNIKFKITNNDWLEYVQKNDK